MKYYITPENTLAAIRDRFIQFHCWEDETGFEYSVIHDFPTFEDGLQAFVDDFSQNGYFDDALNDAMTDNPDALPLWQGEPLPFQYVYRLPEKFTVPADWSEIFPG